MKKLNDDYGSAWRAGWKPKDRMYYSMRMKIIDRICEMSADGEQQSMPRYEEAVERLEKERGKTLLDALARMLRQDNEAKDNVYFSLLWMFFLHYTRCFRGFFFSHYTRFVGAC